MKELAYGIEIITTYFHDQFLALAGYGTWGCRVASDAVYPPATMLVGGVCNCLRNFRLILTGKQQLDQKQKSKLLPIEI